MHMGTDGAGVDSASALAQWRQVPETNPGRKVGPSTDAVERKPSDGYRSVGDP